MQNEWNKEAIKEVLKFLSIHEPECHFCDSCRYYLNEKECLERQKQIEILHKDWENKKNKWETRLKYAK